MPTNAFVNLTKLKKQKLVSDGFIAFSKLKYKQTNVNEITRELGITRTAFYYYFNDKKDFYDYLLYEKKYSQSIIKMILYYMSLGQLLTLQDLLTSLGM